MRVLVTGSSGFVGSRVVHELLEHGHSVVGLVRSDDGAAAVKRLGAEPVRGSLDDVGSITDVARTVDGVVHCAFKHDFENHAANCATDARVVQALCDALEGTHKPLVISSGIGLPGKGNDEDHPGLEGSPRSESEKIARSAASKGVRSSIIRLPPCVHGEDDTGFLPLHIDLARRHGKAGYVGDGSKLWSGAHVKDVARLYRLALEKGVAGSAYHAMENDAGVPLKTLAETIGKHLHLPAVSLSPEEGQAYYGWLSFAAAIDFCAPSVLTRQRLGWQPTGPTLLDEVPRYIAAGVHSRF